MATNLCDTDGILWIVCEELGVSITGEYYAFLVNQLKQAIKEKRRAPFARQCARAHKPRCGGCRSLLLF